MRGFFKLLFWILAIPLSLLLVILIALQFPAVQSYVTGRTTRYLSAKLKTKVTLKEINLAFPEMIGIKELYVEDQEKDTLLYAGSLKVDINLWDLLSKKVNISKITLRQSTGHIYRANQDFNFGFIVDAFAAPEKREVQPDTTGSSWNVSLKTISLENIFFTFHDAVAGVNADLNLGELKTDFESFDLGHKKIHLGTLDLKRSSLRILTQPVIEKKSSPSEPFAYDLGVSKIVLSGIKFKYKDLGSLQNVDVDLGQLALDLDEINIKTQTIKLKRLTLAGTRVDYLAEKIQNAKEKKVSGLGTQHEPASRKDWSVTLKDLNLKNNTITYSDKNQTPVAKGFDFHNISAKEMSLQANDLYLDPVIVKLNLETFAVKEQSGIQVKQLRTRFIYDSTHIKLSGLVLETLSSKIKGEFGLNYASIEELGEHPEKATIEAGFNKTSVAVSDVLYFAPELFNEPVFNGKQHTSISLNGEITGTTNDLWFNNIEIKTLESTSIFLNGNVKNVKDPNAMYIGLNRFEIHGTDKDIFTVFSRNLVPKEISIPSTFVLKGSFTGYLKNFNADLNARTSTGNLTASAKMNPAKGNSEQPYHIKISTEEFDPGKLLNQTELLGPVTMSAHILGTGFDLKKFDADVEADVKSAVFKKYEYKNLVLKGKLNDRSFTGKININDENVVFDYDGSFSFDPAKPNYVFTLDLKGADLKALNLSEEEFRVSAVIESDIHDRSDKNFTGKASVKNALLIRNNHKYPLDSLVFISEVKEGVTKISLRSEIMTADFNGDITLSQLPAALKKHVNSYFMMESLDKQNLNAQKFDFEFRLLDPTMLTKNLVPDLKTITPFALKGNFDSETKNLDLKGEIPQVIYDGIKVDSLKVNISSNSEKMSYQLGLAEASNTTFKFENLTLRGELKNSTLSFKLNTNKDDSAKTISIAGIVAEKNGGYRLKIDPVLTLNAENWAVDPLNNLDFGAEGFGANRLIISKGSSAIALNSTGQGAPPPIELKFTNFELSVLSKLIENKEDLAAGRLNGHVVFEKHNGAAGFKSDLMIDDFKFKAVPIGSIQLKADNFESAGKYNLDLSIAGNGNNLKIKGSYAALVKDNNLDFTAEVTNINLAAIEPFTFGEVTRMSGGLNGRLRITGSTSAPDINGDLSFNESAFRPRLIDSYLKIPAGKMSFASKKVMVNKLAIYDSLENKATLNGYVGIADLTNVDFDAQLNTTNFLALNTKRKDNPLYFGRVYLDSDIGIKGNAASPQIVIKAKLNKGSFITYVRPETFVGKNESKGVVEFTDSLYRPDIMSRSGDTLKSASEIKGINLDASITFDRSVALKMLVDQESGDSLYVLGGGTLDFTMDKTGRTTLTGRYRINDGGYHLAISDVVKRNFKIEKGSSVTWSGDVFEPYVDLKAIYTIKTSPVDLVQDELVGMSELERNKYRNLLTFNVYLKMVGFISAPDISFDIQLAPGDRGSLNGAIDNKLGQLRGDESEMNKQVFALLTLRRFIGTNPLENGNEGGLTSASRSSASQVLTQQLSTLSDKYVNFVDLDLGVNSFEDYSTGVEEGRTQLQVGVSKQILNNKVTVRVGGNVELEGERASQNNANDVAGNISIDYRLTKDGRYKLKAFRENQYENPIEGELTKTGAGLIYVRNFGNFKELLKKPEKAKAVKSKDAKESKERNENENERDKDKSVNSE